MKGKEPSCLPIVHSLAPRSLNNFLHRGRKTWVVYTKLSWFWCQTLLYHWGGWCRPLLVFSSNIHSNADTGGYWCLGPSGLLFFIITHRLAVWSPSFVLVSFLFPWLFMLMELGPHALCYILTVHWISQHGGLTPLLFFLFLMLL